MRYYVCFDGYGHLRNTISEKELTEQYNNDPDEFLKAMCSSCIAHGTSINRAYYAMFYAVLAFLVLEKKETPKHGGVIAIFDRDFVKKGVHRFIRNGSSPG